LPEEAIPGLSPALRAPTLLGVTPPSLWSAGGGILQAWQSCGPVQNIRYVIRGSSDV